MKAIVFLFTGFMLLAVGIFLYFILGMQSTKGTGQSESLGPILQYSIGGGLALLGLIFLVAGIKQRSRDKQQQKQNAHILQTGIATEGTVTYFDKNYSIRVNKVPIYSIVEYTYKDRMGNQYTRRVETVPSELAIRSAIQVGKNIPVKYAAEDASKSVIVL